MLLERSSDMVAGDKQKVTTVLLTSGRMRIPITFFFFAKFPDPPIKNPNERLEKPTL